MKSKFYPLLLIILTLSFYGCKKESTSSSSLKSSATGPTTFKVTSPEYIDSLLFVNINGYQIKTSDPGATFSCSDSHVIMNSKGLIARLTSAETVPIVITWSNPSIPKTTIYALGATDNNQDAPFTHYQGVIATDCYGSYVQGWKTLQKLPV